MAVLAGVLAIPALATTANAFEFGFPGYEQKPGFFLGVTAAPAPVPEGGDRWYSVTRFVDYNAKLVGPGAPRASNGSATTAEAEVASETILWASGYHFLGGAYEAAVIEPAVTTDIGVPVNGSRKGLHNTLFVNQLGWKLSDSGFFVKTALLTWAPTGTQSGTGGLGSVGNPWWTFQPAVLVSYLKDGWNLTLNVSDEIATKNTITQYQTGEILHVDVTATKTFGNWTLGPVAYYAGQITNDRSSAFYNNAININRFNQWAVGGLLGYNFGPVKIDFWILNEVAANAYGGSTPARPGVDTALITKGFTSFVALTVPFGSTPTTTSPANLLHK